MVVNNPQFYVCLPWTRYPEMTDRDEYVVKIPQLSLVSSPCKTIAACNENLDSQLFIYFAKLLRNRSEIPLPKEWDVLATIWQKAFDAGKMSVLREKRG